MQSANEGWVASRGAEWEQEKTLWLDSAMAAELSMVLSLLLLLWPRCAPLFFCHMGRFMCTTLGITNTFLMALSLSVSPGVTL